MTLEMKVILSPGLWDRYMRSLAGRWISGWFAGTATPPCGIGTVHEAEWLAREIITAIYERDRYVPADYVPLARPCLRRGEYDSSYWTGIGER